MRLSEPHSNWLRRSKQTHPYMSCRSPSGTGCPSLQASKPSQFQLLWIKVEIRYRLGETPPPSTAESSWIGISSTSNFPPDARHQSHPNHKESPSKSMQRRKRRWALRRLRSRREKLSKNSEQKVLMGPRLIISLKIVIVSWDLCCQSRASLVMKLSNWEGRSMPSGCRVAGSGRKTRGSGRICKVS